MMTNEAPFNTEELNRAWCDLISKYVMIKVALEKELAAMRADNERLQISNEDLQARLHQAELDLIAVRGKQVIDNG